MAWASCLVLESFRRPARLCCFVWPAFPPVRPP